MSITEFSQELVNALKSRGMDVVGCESIRNNGEVLNGISFRQNRERVAPIMYINRYYELFSGGDVDFDGVVEKIVTDYERLPMPAVPDLEEMFSSPDIIDRINLRIVNEDMNRAIIDDKQLINRRVQDTDLTCLFYITVFLDEAGQGSVAINKEIFNRYLTELAGDADELYSLVTNRKCAEDIVLEPIEDVLDRLTSNKAFEAIAFPPESKGFLYVLTNQTLQFGASSILMKDAADKILEAFPEGKVTIIPSSVSELLLLRSTSEMSIDCLRGMVRDVNDTCLCREDILSYNIYRYDANTGRLEIAE